MIEISIERNRIKKSLNELENDFKNGNIPKSHYESQKRQLTERLETLAVAERVMKLQGKKTVETPVETRDESEDDELFKKYITSPGLKQKNIQKEKDNSQNTMIAAALLIVAFVVGIGFGIYMLNIPAEVSSASLFTDDSAFPPFVLSNATNTTNTTKTVLNTTKPTSNSTTQPAKTTTKTNTSTKNSGSTGTSNKTNAAGDPSTSNTSN